jgi:hypothetical protein
MQTTVESGKTVWVYSDGNFVNRVLDYKTNMMEDWYEDAKTLQPFDPFYVDADYTKLFNRVRRQVQEELIEAKNKVTELKALLKSL